VLNDLTGVEELMKRAARYAGATIVASVFHPFSPQGVSGVVVVEESHLSIHTWPELGYAAVDFYTCGECRPERAHEVLRYELKPTSSERLRVERGIGPGVPSMTLDDHMVERDRGGESHGESSLGEEAAEDPFRPGRSARAATVVGAPVAEA
jgi:S-adenosylmethionine decarboxylase proenzyme